jgi:hypothetical protein
MRIRLLVLPVAALLAAWLFTLAFAQETKKAETVEKAEEVTHEYVGANKCKLCHKKDGIYPSWEMTRHAFAYDSLSAEDQKKKELIPYYTTGTTAKGVLLTGVQCEACHGPGSDYKKKSIMSDREKAVANGLIIPDEKTCLRCHHEKAPPALAKIAKDFDFEKMMAKGVHDMFPEEAKAAE